MVFMTRQRVKDLLLRARVVVNTSNVKISRCRLADYVKTLHQKACRTCSTIIFLHPTNQIIDLWRCRWRCRRQIFNSLLIGRATAAKLQKWKMKNARAKRANSFSMVIVQISDVFVPPVIVMVAFSVANKGRKMWKALLILHCHKHFRNNK